MNKLLALLLGLLLLQACTNDEGVRFQPDPFFMNTNTTSVNEADGTIQVSFNISQVQSADLVINFTLTGTATQGVDYTVSGTTVTIPAGQMTVNFPITLLNDTSIEQQENLIITVNTTSSSAIFVDQSDELTLTIIDDESIAYQSGILIANEGNTQAGTVSFVKDISPTPTVTNGIYNAVNSENAGMKVQSIGFYTNKAYIIAAGSNQITVVDRYSFLKETTITTGLNNPRYMTVIGSKAYITNWGNTASPTDDFVAILDLNSNTVTGTITVGEGPEQILAKGNKLYISHTGGTNFNNIVSIVDITNTSTVNTLTVGDVPNDMIFDALFNIWVVCEGKPASSGAETPGKLVRINTVDDSILTTLDFTGNTHPSGVAYDASQLYYHVNGSIFKMQENETTLPTTPVITSAAYSMVAKDGKLYVGDAGNGTSDGTFKIYKLTDNSLENSVTVGVNPGAIYFN